MILTLFFASSVATAEFNNSYSEEDEIDRIASERLYPGGIDEDDLQVQAQKEDVKPHVSTQSLLWNARRSASSTKPKTKQRGSN